jgi:hypothetical protein
MLQRVLLQYWQNVQSGQGFFFKTAFFSILLVYARSCIGVKLEGELRPLFSGNLIMTYSLTSGHVLSF